MSALSEYMESVTGQKHRDCRVPEGDTPVYQIEIDGEMTLQNRMFTRADMSFWGFSAADVIPPEGSLLGFYGAKDTGGSEGEPFWYMAD